MDTFNVGTVYTSFTEFKQLFDNYCASTSSVFVLKSAKNVDSYNKRVLTDKGKYPVDWKYVSVTLQCKHYGHYKSLSTGKRKQQETFKTGCTALLRLSASKSKNGLVITESNLHHTGHNNIETVNDAMNYPELRRLSEAQKEILTSLFDMKVTSAEIIRHFQQSSGIVLTPQDVVNLRTRLRKDKDKTEETMTREVCQTLVEMDAGATVDLVVDDHSSEYSAAPLPPPKKLPPPQSMRNRISHQEAIICSFIAENSLPLIMAPKLIGLAQLLAKDYKALQSLAMERQMAAYKLKFGLKEFLRKRLVLKLRNSFFSINLDESTTTTKDGKKRILNILVCFFDFDVGKSVTHLYSSVKLSTVNAVTAYEAVMDTLKRDHIPLSNLISVLSDSTAYMRGKSNGFFVKLKSAAPHIIDMDADACHHMHNLSKSFSSSVDPDNHVSKLLDDVFKDLEYSADLREEFLSVCDLLNVKPLLPKERAGHRWLSLLDCCQRFDELKDVLCVFYFSWLSQENQDLFQFKVTGILKIKNVSEESRKSVFGIMKKVRSNDMGKARKSRICHKLFDYEHKTLLLVGIFLSVFPIFKQFLLLFERKTPMLHVLRDEQLDIFRKFLQFFVQPKYIQESGKELDRLSLSLSRKDILLPAEHVFVGSCSQVLLEMDDDDVKSFRSRLLGSYLSAAIYMQSKLPLNNSLLRIFSFLDPKLFGRGSTAISLKRLPKFLPTIYVSNFDSEIMEMQSDMDISADDCCELDVWWARVFRLNRYPSVTNIVSACLSVFTGPRVEQSCCLMNAVISENKSSPLISTYEAYMFPRYHLLSVDSSTLRFYERKNNVTSPVDSSLVYHLHSAASRMSRDKRRAGEHMEAPPAKKMK